MLLRRLPRPQLLLPAWPTTSLPSTQRYIGKGSGQPSSKPVGSKLGAHLFDLLFPEDSKTPAKAIPPNISSKNQEKNEGERKLEWGKLDQLLSSPASILTSASIDALAPEETPFGDEAYNAVRKHDSEATIKRQNASILVLSNASKALAESDFLRLSPRGRHIDSWAAGIIKVIPGRDPQTLAPLGHYFILFSSDAAARAYHDQVVRLHDISKRYTFTSIPIPPGYIKDGEDIPALLKAFTLVPPSQEKPRLTILTKPFRPAVARLIAYGALPVVVEQQVKSDALVLFALDRGHLSVFDLEMLLGKDGRARNRLWNLWGGGIKGAAIHKLTSARVAAVEKNEDSKVGEDGEPRKQVRRPPSRFIVAFRNMKEARRFVRAWHRRELPSLRDEGRNPEDEAPPVVTAELLW